MSLPPLTEKEYAEIMKRRAYRQQEEFAGPVGIALALVLGIIIAAIHGAY